MQSRILILIVFGVWCLISWRWYVCGIKQVCGTETAAAAIPQPVETAPIRETPGIETEEQPTQTPGNQPEPVQPIAGNTTAPKPSSELSGTPANLDRVQIEDLDDHVVIHFPYNSTSREDNEAIDDYLSKLAAFLTQTGKSITITGHTDMIGDAKSNESIGLQRALQIRKTLVAKGAAEKQVKCRSYGENKPVSTNDTPRGRYLNRRVEIRINP